MDMLSVGDAISNYVLIFISIAWFVIAWTSVLGVFFVQSDDIIFDEAFLEAYPFFFDVLYVWK